MEGNRKVPLVRRKNVKSSRDKHRDFCEKVQAARWEESKEKD